MNVLKPLSLSLLLLAACNQDQPATPTAQEEPASQVTVEDQGKDVYMLYCAQCHGDTGDGTSRIAIDRPARSFIDGGFSFGNTIHAISKTTASGIPGTPMPPFVDVLTPSQIKQVATYVRAFAPALAEATLDETELIVEDRPVVARGMLPPLENGLPMYPRGLMVGNPDRFSYEYAADNVRLLAIRQGDFVRRTDWTDRGGATLEVLGNIVVLIDGGNPAPMFTTGDDMPLKAQLKSTKIIGEYATVSYDLVDPSGSVIATVQEHCTPTTGVRTLIEQHLSVDTPVILKITPPASATMLFPPMMNPGKHDIQILHAGKGEGS